MYLSMRSDTEGEKGKGACCPHQSKSESHPMVLTAVRLKMSKRLHVTHSGALALLAKWWSYSFKGKLETIWKRNLLRLNKYAEMSFVLGQKVADLKV